MLGNYFKTTFRSLWKSKSYSILNIFGLTVGIACAGLIFLWVEDETNFDQFNVKKDRLYFVRENQKYDTYTATFGSTPGVMAPALQAEVPGIAATCRMSEDNARALFTVGEKSMYANGHYVEASLFTMFTLPFVEGNAKTAFAQLYSIVITQKTARKFFGDDKNIVGKTVRVDNKQDYVVTGVIKDIPDNSTLQFDWVAPFQIWFDQSPWAHVWGNNCLTTYVELKPGITAGSVNKLLYGFIQAKTQSTDKSVARPFLWSMNDWHLRNEFDNGVQTGGGTITNVHLFTLIAWIILLIACINFMNLATVRSEKRAKEVGVRKVLGAGRGSLISQFMGEAMFMAALSALLAVAVMILVIPAFNTLVRKNLAVDVQNSVHLAVLVAITLVCGLLAGSYPSVYLSSFNPVFIFKGIRLKDGSASVIRKGMVVLQFTVSIILIISTLIIYRQIQHVKGRTLGFNKNNLLQASVVGDIGPHFAAIRQDLLNTGAVDNVALSDHVLLYDGNNTGSLTWDGKSPDAQILVSGRYVTPEFLRTCQLKLLSGRDFVSTDSTTSKNVNVIITRSLEKLMGLKSSLGKTIRNTGDTSGTKLTVVGVIDDYMYGNMYERPDPVVFLCTAPQNTTEMYIRMKEPAKIETTLLQIESVMKKYNLGYPFTYEFVDDQFNNLFLNELMVEKLSKVFAALAIVISSLGLFGLAAYTAARRTKEIGVRKVLGASVVGITALLSADFLQLVAMSCLIAFPVSWWIMHNWLLSYQYRIDISWWIFLVAGTAALLIALFTVSFQAIKAAIANPVHSLRTE